MKKYFDAELALPLSEGVVEAMRPYIEERWLHAQAPYYRENLREHYESIYALLDASHEHHFVMTSSGAEAVNQVVLGTYIDVVRKTGKNHVMASALDEAAPIMSMTRLQEMGCLFQMVPASEEGLITAEEVAATCTPRTALFSLSLANGLTGVVQEEIDEIGSLCEERGILFHLDVTHALGKIPFSFDESPAHFVTFNGDQIGAPKGTGGLFIRSGCELSPLILGGKEQGGMRGGTLSTQLLAGLGRAAFECLENRESFAMECARKRAQFEKLLGETILFEEHHRLPNVSCIAFDRVNAEALCYHLAQRQLFASMGGGQFQQIAYLLQAAHIDPLLRRRALSFALHIDVDVKESVEIIHEVVAKLQKQGEVLWD